jgi:hypothetical protein
MLSKPPTNLPYKKAEAKRMENYGRTEKNPLFLTLTPVD